MGYGRKRYERKNGGNSSFGLNITSMTDMFTILLVFLLQTYSTAEVQVNPDEGLRLPLSNAESNTIFSLKVSISGKELKVQDKVVMTLKEGVFEKSDIDPQDKNFLPAFFKELDSIMKSTDKDYIKDGKIMLLADSSLTYETLRKVMYTSSMAGFPKLKIATVLGN